MLARRHMLPVVHRSGEAPRTAQSEVSGDSLRGLSGGERRLPSVLQMACDGTALSGRSGRIVRHHGRHTNTPISKRSPLGLTRPVIRPRQARRSIPESDSRQSVNSASPAPAEDRPASSASSAVACSRSPSRDFCRRGNFSTDGTSHSTKRNIDSTAGPVWRAPVAVRIQRGRFALASRMRIASISASNSGASSATMAAARMAS